MIARSKFELVSKKEFPGNGNTGFEYEFRAVYDDGTPENKKFHQWTPNGKFEFYITNPEVIKMLETERVFYLDLIPVTEPQTDEA